MPHYTTLRPFKEVLAIAAIHDGLLSIAKKRLDAAASVGGPHGQTATPVQKQEFREARQSFKKQYAVSAALNKLKKVLHAAMDDLTEERIKRIQEALNKVYALAYFKMEHRDSRFPQHVNFFRWPQELWTVFDPTGELRSRRAYFYREMGYADEKAETAQHAVKHTYEQLTEVNDELNDLQKTAVLFKHLEAWEALPTVSGHVKPSFREWVQNQVDRHIHPD